MPFHFAEQRQEAFLLRSIPGFFIVAVDLGTFRDCWGRGEGVPTARFPIASVVIRWRTEIKWLTSRRVVNIVNSKLPIADIASFVDRIATAAFASMVLKILDMRQCIVYRARSATLEESAAFRLACDTSWISFSKIYIGRN